MKYILLSLLLITGCAERNDNIPEQVRIVDPELETYVAAFEARLGYQISYPVQFGKIDAGYMGICEAFENGGRQIILDIQTKDYTPEKLESLVFHELGHCSLGREHDDSHQPFTWIRGLYPKSVMRSWPLNSQEAHVYGLEREYYLDELFNP